MKKKLLVSWIGHSDIRAMAVSLAATQRDEILKKIGGEVPRSGDQGPTRTLLDTQSFDEVRLLSNYAAEWNKRFLTWIRHDNAEVVPVGLEKPTDYVGIFKAADDELSTIRKRKDWSATELGLHLSPGTPAMTAVWLLLGKTRYPAKFYETFAGNSWVTEVPFDLTIDVIPEIFRDPDAYLQHLASESPGEVEGFQDIVGDSRVICDAVGRAKRAAMRGLSILLLGESGTGKEMFAQAIHKASPRRDKPFVAINCAALSRTLLESELFGHSKGAFTGAERERRGAFEQADCGTIFLDEVGECDLETQAKLLRVLEPVQSGSSSQRAIRRLGDEKERKVDVRVIAATNRDLFKAIGDGAFREDLYYRLASVTITIPPLRDRRSDIPKLVEKLLAQLNRQFEAEEPDYKHKSLSAAANAFVKRHDWPGNVRQLRNVLVQAAVFANKEILGQGDIVAALGEVPGGDRSLAALTDRSLGNGFDIEEHLNRIRTLYLQKAMEEAGGVKAEAARLLGMKHYQTLDAQLTRFGVTGDWNT